MAYRPLLECLQRFIAVVNLFLPGYDSDHFMFEKTEKYFLQSPIKVFRTSHCSCQFVYSGL